MWKKKLTIMLIPGSDGTPRQISIPGYLIYGCVGAALILLFSNFFFSAEFFSDRVANKELITLRAENQALQDKFEQMRWKLAEVASRYDELIDKEIKIRCLFDIPQIDNDQRQLGIGGPSFPITSQRSETEELAYETESEIDHLLLVSEFELSAYQEVESSMMNIKDRLEHTPSIWPTRGLLSRGYGMKNDPFTGVQQMHRGIDIANHIGTSVIATADGKVFSARKNGGMGKTVVIDHGYGFKTRYAHLSEYHVKAGQRIKRGDIIGLMGSTGYSTGPHLHYEITRNGRSLDPYNYILNEM
jgi:hypothetical protein